MGFIDKLPAAWSALLRGEIESERFERLSAFLASEYAAGKIFPPEDEIFTALRLTPPGRVKAVILGQDPYHGDGQAHGLAFSVRPGTKFPASLRNIFKEYTADTGFEPPETGSLVPWAENGVLLLNTVLTVRAHKADSHKGRGWEAFTDAVISAIDAFDRPVVFLLWGLPAQAKKRLITNPRHHVISSPHPSPLSAYRGFFGSRPFSKINECLLRDGLAPVDFRLPRGVGLVPGETRGEKIHSSE